VEFLKARVVAVCRGKEKGQPKEGIRCGFFEKGLGLVGDAHAGAEKQVSILMKESVDHLSATTGFTFPPGSFAENILVEGLDASAILPGRQLKIGPVILRVVRIGKEPGASHAYHYLGYSLLPRLGIFAQVMAGGLLKIGDEVELLGDDF
jgi:MOSC domain-containing protein YiiM